MSPLLNSPKNALISERAIPNQKAGQNPETEKLGTTSEAKRINSALITRENIPRVRIVTGRAINLTIGLINIFIIPSTTAKIIAPHSVTSTPGTSSVAIIIEKTENKK